MVPGPAVRGGRPLRPVFGFPSERAQFGIMISPRSNEPPSDSENLWVGAGSLSFCGFSRLFVVFQLPTIEARPSLLGAGWNDCSGQQRSWGGRPDHKYRISPIGQHPCATNLFCFSLTVASRGLRETIDGHYVTVKGQGRPLAVQSRPHASRVD